MAKLITKKLDSLESMIMAVAGSDADTVFGFYQPSDNGPKLSHCLKMVGGKLVHSSEEPTVRLPVKMEPIITRPKRFIVVVGGRGSGKSEGIGAKEAVGVKDNGLKVGCFREFQNAIEDSVHPLISGKISQLGLGGYTIQEKTISHISGGRFRFKGLARDPEGIKSMFGFDHFWIEEAQSVSEESLKKLTPTMRKASGQIIFTANPGSSEDPLSRRFIVPFLEALERDGIYEDDLHLVIVINWKDNPWFPVELEQERLWDYNNLSRALYDHIWEGKFNDSVDDSIIPAEWFDAAIDAHKKLGWKPSGMKIVSYDPADMGGDAKALSLRHGSLVLDVQEKLDGDVNDATDWATNYAIDNRADLFTWDCDGLGASLRRQVTEALAGKKVEIIQFKGSESPDNAEAIYQQCDDVDDPKSWRKNKDVFQKKRSQFYKRLADRFFNTYRAVHKGEYVDPADMISLSSDIKSLAKLRAELCRIPRKANGNGYFQIMTKDEMKSKLKIKSPNMADAVMMSMLEWSPVIKPDYSNYTIPCGVG